jgi:hypothetical protein
VTTLRTLSLFRARIASWLRPRNIKQASVLNPYLVASNGPGPNQRVSYAANAKKDDLNPEFFQVLDLATKVPEKCKLEVQVWNKGFVTGNLIGSVWIDLETRLLQQVEAHRQAALDARVSGFVPTTEYHDLKNDTARTSQDKRSMKLEMLADAEARRTKPDDVAPPSQEYELRMVIWNTRDVRFPVDKDSVSGGEKAMTQVVYVCVRAARVSACSYSLCSLLRRVVSALRTARSTM